jgi:hypothetical protein
MYQYARFKENGQPMNLNEMNLFLVSETETSNRCRHGIIPIQSCAICAKKEVKNNTMIYK